LAFQAVETEVPCFDGMALVMEEDELADPVSVGFFGATAVMTNADHGPDPVQQAWFFHNPSNNLKSIAKQQQ
jgi:hypothetical protein